MELGVNRTQVSRAILTVTAVRYTGETGDIQTLHAQSAIFDK